MAEATQYLLDLREIAEILVKNQDVHEGHWAVLVKFGIAATNAPGPTGDLLPTAIVPILAMGIQKFDEPNTMTVDAAVVNPAPKEHKYVEQRKQHAERSAKKKVR